MENRTLKFELDSNSIKIKKLLEGDFLRLEAYTISDANPNVNKSHFTIESLKQAIPTFYDKPVLAYYNPNLGPDGDFMGHECPNGLQYDQSLDIAYNDYTAPKSEIPIGTIRQSDTVELVQKDGLNWIRVTCVLWTKYNYKAVRSLLRSKKGKTKLSVEIEVLKSHIDDRGIEIIEEFQLDGFTLLGKNIYGREIQEGIAGAQAYVIDFLDKKFAEHQKCLAFAYSAFDNYNKNQLKTLDIEPEKGESEKTLKLNSFEEIGNKDLGKGGIQPVQLTMRAKMDLLQAALNKALITEEDKDYYVWLSDLDDTYVYYEFKGVKFRCPYAITILGEEHEVALDLSAQERVVATWAVFTASDQEKFDGEEICPCKKNCIHDLIIDEHQAIEGYNKAEAIFEDYPAIAKIFHEIAEEEMVHIGELEQALQLVSDETIKHLEEGQDEAKDIIIEKTLEENEEGEEGEEGGSEEGQEPAQGMQVVEFASDSQENCEEAKTQENFEENKEEEPKKDDKEDDKDDDDSDDDKSDDSDDDPDDKDDSEDDDQGKQEEFENPENEKKDEIKFGCESPEEPKKGITEEAKQECCKFVMIDGEKCDLDQLYTKYTELQSKMTAFEKAEKERINTEIFCSGKAFIDADTFVDEKTKEDFASQLETKCKNSEFSCSDDAIAFAKNLIGVYYYEHREDKRPESKTDFSFSILKGSKTKSASNQNLKDAISKLQKS